jgi:hypothetical protein
MVCSKRQLTRKLKDWGLRKYKTSPGKSNITSSTGRAASTARATAASFTSQLSSQESRSSNSFIDLPSPVQYHAIEGQIPRSGHNSDASMQPPPQHRFWVWANATASDYDPNHQALQKPLPRPRLWFWLNNTASDYDANHQPLQLPGLASSFSPPSVLQPHTALYDPAPLGTAGAIRFQRTVQQPRSDEHWNATSAKPTPPTRPASPKLIWYQLKHSKEVEDFSPADWLARSPEPNTTRLKHIKEVEVFTPADWLARSPEPNTTRLKHIKEVEVFSPADWLARSPEPNAIPLSISTTSPPLISLPSIDWEDFDRSFGFFTLPAVEPKPASTYNSFVPFSGAKSKSPFLI